jgi:hypothetical protein
MWSYHMYDRRDQVSECDFLVRLKSCVRISVVFVVGVHFHGLTLCGITFWLDDSTSEIFDKCILG